jgi:hypothetical protein
MESLTITQLLALVFKSWQVYAVTAAIIFYLYLISLVSRSNRRPKRAKKVKVAKRREKTMPSGPEEAISGADTNEELGIEEM